METAMDSDELEERLLAAFHPETIRQVERVRRQNVRFVHYTSAESGIAILRSKRMLLRNSTLLNDFSEVQHGMNCLSHAWQSDAGERLRAIMQRVQADLPEVFQSNFDNMFMDFRTETYLISVSEHGDPLGDQFEDLFGRLSMWRAYASKNGIAFVFHNTPFVTESNVLDAYTSPVVYATPETFAPHFTELVDNLEAILDIIAPWGGEWLHENLVNAFRFAIQSTKHPAFREEREWRVIYNPTPLQKDPTLWAKQLEKVPTDIMVLGGVPQRVFAVPFKSYPDEGFVGATIPELIERVLIGPSADAYAIQRAFVAELLECGVSDAEKRVMVTNIPLRI
jgi:hypothetical protein